MSWGDFCPSIEAGFGTEPCRPFPSLPCSPRRCHQPRVAFGAASAPPLLRKLSLSEFKCGVRPGLLLPRLWESQIRQQKPHLVSCTAPEPAAAMPCPLSAPSPWVSAMRERDFHGMYHSLTSLHVSFPCAVSQTNLSSRSLGFASSTWERFACPAGVQRALPRPCTAYFPSCFSSRKVSPMRFSLFFPPPSTSSLFILKEVA